MSPVLAKLLAFPLTLFVLVLGVIVAYRLLTGRIVTRGLLTDKATGQVSGLRVQMLIGTIAAGAVYAAEIGRHRGAHALPPVDPKLLALVGGSNVLVLGKQALAKLVASFRS